MHRGFTCLDPDWKMISASLRKGVLYVKMPVAIAVLLGAAWKTVSARFHERDILEIHRNDALFKLIGDELEGSIEYGIGSVFYSTPIDVCEKDIEALKTFADKDTSTLFQSFVDALEAGLKSDPAVDWITRVGGPKPNAFEALQPEPEPVQLSLDDLDVAIDV